MRSLFPNLEPRVGAFGMTVMEYPAPQWIAYAVLHESGAYLARDVFGNILRFFPSQNVRATPGVREDGDVEREVVSDPGDLRSHFEKQAHWNEEQPPGWDRLYESVTGMRWRCCGAPFEDGEHTPWCEVVR